MAEVTPVYNDTSNDLLFAILTALGGTMADVKNLYYSVSDDLLHAILELLSSGKVALVVDRFYTVAENPDRSTVNYPAIIGANNVIVTIGGMFIDSADHGSRYFLADTLTGDIDLPPVSNNELVIIFKF